MTESAGGLTAEEREELIQDFETTGMATFRIGADQAQFDVLSDYIRKNMVPTQTTVDKEAGVVSLTKRPWGSLELM